LKNNKKVIQIEGTRRTRRTGVMLHKVEFEKENLIGNLYNKHPVRPVRPVRKTVFRENEEIFDTLNNKPLEEKSVKDSNFNFRFVCEIHNFRSDNYDEWLEHKKFCLEIQDSRLSKVELLILELLKKRDKPFYLLRKHTGLSQPKLINCLRRLRVLRLIEVYEHPCSKLTYVRLIENTSGSPGVPIKNKT